MKRLLTLSFQYYYLLLVYNLAFSFAIGILFLFDAHTLSFSSSLTAKIIGYGCAVLLYGYTYSKTYFYFRNAGITMVKLVITTFIVDIVVFVLLVLLTIFLKTL